MRRNQKLINERNDLLRENQLLRELNQLKAKSIVIDKVIINHDCSKETIYPKKKEPSLIDQAYKQYGLELGVYEHKLYAEYAGHAVAEMAFDLERSLELQKKELFLIAVKKLPYVLKDIVWRHNKRVIQRDRREDERRRNQELDRKISNLIL